MNTLKIFRRPVEWNFLLSWDQAGIVFPAKNIRRYSQLPKHLILKKNHDGVPTNRMVIILSWMEANPKIVDKYAQYYLNQRCDSLVVYLTWYNALWTGLGAKAIAKYILEFLQDNQSYSRVIIHGFSAGSLVWGNMLDFMKQDEFSAIRERIDGQIWDSVAINAETLIKGFPRTFLRNRPLQLIFENYLRFHGMIFYNWSGRSFYKSMSLMSANNVVHTPILVFTSKDDRVFSSKSVTDGVQLWREKGLRVDLKIWDSSPHVSHFLHHKDEYEDLVKDFVSNLNFVPLPNKFGQPESSLSNQ
ncbi:unnamed protein product [Allacma fusca]|uniref:Uncharacterized protein n=1 Tax=Allacma fusca TaxID=39272 RepID=A0A8J2PKU3_9HEXA|nr:unnamed protein product [Allacma fusca]